MRYTLDEAFARHYHRTSGGQTMSASDFLLRRCAEVEAARAVLEAKLAAAVMRADAAEAAAERAVHQLEAVRAGHGSIVQRSIAPAETENTTRRVRVGKVPAGVSLDELRLVLTHFGSITDLEVFWDDDGGCRTAIAVYEDADAAARAAERLDGMHLGAETLHVKLELR
mmetsp:Transcript_22645/g.66766  ORF Transcript_22645/g.66766 Transcript_22645/m.66766 type:complete len:169 (-) Transcript_22645:294-800(-)